MAQIKKKTVQKICFHICIWTLSNNSEVKQHIQFFDFLDTYQVLNQQMEMLHSDGKFRSVSKVDETGSIATRRTLIFMLLHIKSSIKSHEIK